MMEHIAICGGERLSGTVSIEGAKNSVLPILAASLLVEKGITTLNNVPVLSDVYAMIQILKSLNVGVDFNEEINQIRIDATKPLNVKANYEYVRRMRASIVIMGPMLARNGYVKIALPGGCAIGKRPFDLHLKGLHTLGARTVKNNNSYIEAIADVLTGRNIHLDCPSVGATENIMMAAVKARGVTIIENAAKDPEIEDLANFLNKIGAKVLGAGTSKMRIEGVETLYAISHTIIQDRIEAGTFMIAAAMTQGNVLVKDAIVEHNAALIRVLTKMGVIIRKEDNGIRVIGPKVLKPTNIITLPYPGFPTDLQAQMSAILMIAQGPSAIVETIFENRFQHLIQMQLMNGLVNVEGNMAILNGSSSIQGADVSATDLRAAAALVLLGLCASGVTRVTNLEYLDRGYSKFHEKLQRLGALLERINSE